MWLNLFQLINNFILNTIFDRFKRSRVETVWFGCWTVRSPSEVVFFCFFWLDVLWRSASAKQWPRLKKSQNKITFIVWFLRLLFTLANLAKTKHLTTEPYRFAIFLALILIYSGRPKVKNTVDFIFQVALFKCGDRASLSLFSNLYLRCKSYFCCRSNRKPNITFCSANGLACYHWLLGTKVGQICLYTTLNYHFLHHSLFSGSKTCGGRPQSSRFPTAATCVVPGFCFKVLTWDCF